MTRAIEYRRYRTGCYAAGPEVEVIVRVVPGGWVDEYRIDLYTRREDGPIVRTDIWIPGISSSARRAYAYARYLSSLSLAKALASVERATDPRFQRGMRTGRGRE